MPSQGGSLSYVNKNNFKHALSNAGGFLGPSGVLPNAYKSIDAHTMAEHSLYSGKHGDHHEYHLTDKHTKTIE